MCRKFDRVNTDSAGFLLFVSGTGVGTLQHYNLVDFCQIFPANRRCQSAFNQGEHNGNHHHIPIGIVFGSFHLKTQEA